MKNSKARTKIRMGEGILIASANRGNSIWWQFKDEDGKFFYERRIYSNIVSKGEICGDGATPIGYLNSDNYRTTYPIRCLIGIFE